MRYFFFTVSLSLLCTVGFAQTPITVEAIWSEYAFVPNSVPGFNFRNDGRHYTRLENNQIKEYDLISGETGSVLLDGNAIEGFDGRIQGYRFSADEQKILFWTGTEAIYRHSTRAAYYVWDGRQSKPVFEDEKQRLATLNPQGDKVAFVLDNNLFYKDLANDAVVQVTNDGEENRIINGATDWVYEEEFSFSRAFEWSPDGQRLAFYRFDESGVREFTMTNYHDELYPEYVTFKYPKVGEDNALVSIHVYDLPSAASTLINLGETYEYVPRIKWTQGSDQLCVFRMNRHQSELELLLADPVTGNTRLLLRETNDSYIDIHDNLHFLKDGERFLWTSEQDGWNHLYLYRLDGTLERQITRGEWEVTKFYGIDEATETLFYQAAEQSPMRREIYSIRLDGKKKRQLNNAPGTHSASFSKTFDYYVGTFSTINSAATYTVYDRSGKTIRIIEENTDMRAIQQEYQVQPASFFEFETSEKVTLNGWMIKPANFEPNKQYPVFMFLYGGPGSQQVTDSWKGQNYWWFQMLAQQGYLVACVDNRGTGGRGEAFKKMTYLQLGKYETIDQIEAAKYLGSLPYTDASRIGIFGWSYGGYMSSLCLLKGNDVFKAAIAVAPVTNWKWYDTIYTERYMRTEEENPDGYRDNSPVYFADRLQGSYLLVHGMSDDNVHFQHTAEMANALVAANKQFDTYFYPNRNHSIFGGPTRMHLYNRMTRFLLENL